ncbi:MAG: leucyl aminopeptidase, partial [Marmoricola sp.]
MFVLSSGASAAAAGVVAIALLDDEGSLVLGPGSAALADRLGPDLDLLELFADAEASTSAGAVTRLTLPGVTVLGVGVGDAGTDALRAAGAGLARAAVGLKSVSSTVQAVGDDAGLTAFVAGALLASFRFTLRTGKDPKPPVQRIVLALTAEDRAPVLARAEAIARASSEARRLATTPSNIKSPAWLKDQVLELAAPARLRSKVWDAAALTKEGFGGILAVGRASKTPPYLVQLEYTPAEAGRRTPHVVLVGKGITFDTGGLSIKPGEAMTTMKRDMTGAAVVAATMSALAAVDCPVRVTGLMPMA